MKRLLITVAAALGLASIGTVAMATEEPRYTVVAQHEGIEVKRGRLRLRSLAFESAVEKAPRELAVNLGGQAIAATHTVQDGKIVVSLGSDVTIEAGQRLDVLIRFPAA